MKNREKFLFVVVALHKKGRLLTWEQRAEARWNPQGPQCGILPPDFQS